MSLLRLILCIILLPLGTTGAELHAAMRGVNTERDGHHGRHARYVSSKMYRSVQASSSSDSRSARALKHVPSEPAALHSFAAQMLKKHRREYADQIAAATTPKSEQRTEQTSGTQAELSPEQQKIERELEKASSTLISGGSGRSVCIAITGVDSRLGVAQRHADANHVLRIWLESGRIDIFSIPRGTHVEAGFKSDALNYLANLRSNKGREAYLRKVAEIASVPRIDYWVELGFSQAIGLIEMLGFKDKAASTLHVLRTRKAYAVGDYQRCYNQGQFIRQMILNNFNKSTGFLGTVALRGALGLVETNLTLDAARMIIDELERRHFPASTASVNVYLRPAFKARLKELNLSSPEAITKLNSELNSKLNSGGYIGKSKAPAFDAAKYERQLLAKIQRAEHAIQKSPKTAIATLNQVYKQRSWIQIKNETKRMEYMRRVCEALAQSYDRQGFAIEADNIRYFAEQQLKGSSNMLGTTLQ